MSYDAAHRYERLRRLAEDVSSSDAERLSARAAMARLAARHGEEALGWGDAAIRVDSAIMAQLVVHAAAAFGCSAIGRRGTDEVLVRGPRKVVKQVEREVAKHAPLLEAFMANAALAYLRGAGLYADAQTNVDKSRTQETPDPTTDPREMDALHAILRGFKRLGELKRSTDETRKALPAPRAPSVSSMPYMRQMSYGDAFTDFVTNFFAGVR